MSAQNNPPKNQQPPAPATTPKSPATPQRHLPPARRDIRPSAVCNADRSTANPATTPTTPRTSPPTNTTPLALIRTIADRQIIIAPCPAAHAAGARSNMTLAQARAMCPTLLHSEHDPAGDAKALEALGRWITTRFSPIVQCHVNDPSGGTGLFIDLTGTQRLFGSLEFLHTQISHALHRANISAKIAIASTPGAAWALTFGENTSFAMQEPRIQPRAMAENNGDLRSPAKQESRSSAPSASILHSLSSLPALLAPLPVAGLRVEPTTLDTLHHLGLQTIGQVLALPRDLLPSRFGPLLAQRLDQATGRLHEPLIPLLYQPLIEAFIDFDGIIDSLEAIHLTFKDLINQVTTTLVKKGLGARQMLITFQRPYLPSIEKTIDLSSPNRNPQILFNLIRCAMETSGDVSSKPRKRSKFKIKRHEGAEDRHEGTKAQRHEGVKIGIKEQRDTRAQTSQQAQPSIPSPLVPTSCLRASVPSCLPPEVPPCFSSRSIDPTGFIPSGFTGLRLAIPTFERITESQITLMGPDPQATQEEFHRLAERLKIKLGDNSLLSIKPIESHIPERAYREEQGSGFGVQGSAKSQDAKLAKPHSQSLALSRFSSYPTQRSPQSPSSLRRSVASSLPSAFCLHPSAFPLRPLHLLPTPQEIFVLVKPSHDRDGAPIAFTHQNRQHQIIHAVGPERIAGPWWLGRNKTRDYFDVEDHTSQRWWLFRVTQTSRWFIHGIFE